MAPEQLMSEPSAFSDVYSLGVIAFETLTGKLPFQSGSIVELLQMQREGVKTPPKDLRPDLPDDAAAIILRALAFDPKDRYQRARDFGEELAKALDVHPSGAAGDPVATVAELGAQGRAASPTPNSTTALLERLEPVGGAVPLDSEFYIVRPTDEEFRCAIARRDSIVLVKGARQVGKTSLLARGMEQARESGAQVVLTDFQMLNADQLESAHALFLTLASMVADQLDLDVSPKKVWDFERGASLNFERFMRKEALGNLTEPLVWGLDEVDRLFSCNYASEVFGLFRAWHNARALSPKAPWRRLTLAIAYATEAHLFITDLNQSPFNVGTRLALEDFELDQAAELNRRYGSPLNGGAEIERFYSLAGGHPYLARRGLHEMVARRVSLSELEAQAYRDEGPFGDHLRRMLAVLVQDSELCDVARGVFQGRPCLSLESFYRLRSAGIMSGDSPGNMKFRCQLYAAYLERHLL